MIGAVTLAVAGNAQLFFANLDGLQETPPNASPAFSTCSASLTGGPGTWVLTYTYSYAGMTGSSSAGHFHNAAAGVAGPVKHFLDIQPTGTSGGPNPGDWKFSDGVNPLTDAMASELLAGRIYINLHTSTFPGGEIRGQMLLVPEPGTVAALLTGLTGLIAIRRRRK